MTTFPNTKKRVENTKHSQGPKLTFFRQAPTGDRIFFSVAKWKNVVAKKCW